MANIFLQRVPRDIETAIMLEQAIFHDIGNAIAYTDGDKIFINTEDNLFNILPAYNQDFLKWLLWHERYHKELRHHNRFFRYLSELRDAELKEEFAISKEEVNIIMDILVHDSLSKLFPELVDIAQQNLAQMRNRNSLSYTFTTFTLEEMLDEYKNHKDPDKKEETKEEDKSEDKDEDKSEDKEEDKSKKSHSKDEEEPKEKDDKDSDPKDKPEDKEPEVCDTPKDEHDKTDWDKLKDIDSKEFIDRDESDTYMEQIQRLKNKKFRLGKLTETLNGLATSTRKRTYSMPSSVKIPGGAILKGSVPGKTKLYLCFDASGSMGRELETFKEIISKSIPQAMDVPCEWFTYNYGKGKFKDIMPVHATSGYDDDGDRTIELCFKAEQAGYSPIGVTDGGGRLSWSKDMLRQLKRTILVGQNPHWLEEVKRINPRVQTLDI